MRVEAVGLAPAGVIDHFAAAAQFLDEDIVAQALRGMQIGLALGEAQLEMAVVQIHGPPFRTLATPPPQRGL